MTVPIRQAMRQQITDLAFALAEFRTERGRYPDRLAELRSAYITELPNDLFTGGELHYSREGNGYLLYSIGLNNRDDGGRGYDSGGGDDISVATP